MAAMSDGYYVIYTKLNDNMCLGIDDDLCVIRTFDGTPNFTWTVRAIGGSSEGYFLQHNVTGKCLHFGQQRLQVASKPTVGFGTEYVLTTDDVGDGYTALNNHDHSYVMDVYRSQTVQGTAVNAVHWNKGDNQRWRFIPASVLS